MSRFIIVHKSKVQLLIFLALDFTVLYIQQGLLLQLSYMVIQGNVLNSPLINPNRQGIQPQPLLQVQWGSWRH